MSELQSPNSNQAEPKIIFTTKEIQELGIKCNLPLPEPEHCKYCGRPLYYEGIKFYEMIITIRNVPQRCTCHKAIEYWKRKDEETAKRKAAEIAEQKRQKNQEKISCLIKRSRMMKKYQFCTFDNYYIDATNESQVKAYQDAKLYVAEFEDNKKSGKGLYIEGTNGTGKTHIAAAITLALINRFYKVIFQTANDMLADIKKAYNEYSDCTENEILSKYKNADLLVIDDLGKEQVTNWGVSVLFTIVNYRYAEMLPTIITTNYNEDMLIERLTPKDGDSSNIISIVSRFRETADVITMVWNDYRGGANG